MFNINTYTYTSLLIIAIITLIVYRIFINKEECRNGKEKEEEKCYTWNEKRWVGDKEPANPVKTECGLENCTLCGAKKKRCERKKRVTIVLIIIIIVCVVGALIWYILRNKKSTPVSRKLELGDSEINPLEKIQDKGGNVLLGNQSGQNLMTESQ